MNDATLDLAKAWIRRDEGISLKPYRCTAGKLTIGIGHNLDDKGLSMTIVEEIFREDLDEVIRGLNVHIPWWKELDPPRAAALLNMGFQLGVRGVLGFKKTLAHLERGDFTEAAREALDSAWARQTPARAKRVVDVIRQGGAT